MNDNVSTLEYKDLYYDVPNVDPNIKSKHARLIRSLSGKIESGRLTAVLGSSGCGKTHFLQMLVGEISKKSKTSGEILYNGKEREPEEWKNIMSYLKQDDVFYKDVSVYEHMKIYSSLQSKDSDKIINDKIDEILESCAIIHKKHTLMGALSGGERKRALIAIALVNEPKVLVLDEPTTGLDSNTALEIVFTLKKYAQEKNCMVITTIHQPGAGLFSYFDDLIILVKLGVFYIGPYDEVQDFLINNGITMDNNLSLPEFLFVILSDHSLLPEAKKYRSNVDAIVEQNRKQFKTEKTTYVCNNYTTLTWSTSFSKIFTYLSAVLHWTLGTVSSFWSYWVTFWLSVPYLQITIMILVIFYKSLNLDRPNVDLTTCSLWDLFDISCSVITDLLDLPFVFWNFCGYTSIWSYKEQFPIEYITGKCNFGTYFCAIFVFCFMRVFLYLLLGLIGITVIFYNVLLNPYILLFNVLLCFGMCLIQTCVLMIIETQQYVKSLYIYFLVYQRGNDFTGETYKQILDGSFWIYIIIDPIYSFSLFIRMRRYDLLNRFYNNNNLFNFLAQTKFFWYPNGTILNQVAIYSSLGNFNENLDYIFLRNAVAFTLFILILTYLCLRIYRIPNIRLKFTK